MLLAVDPHGQAVRLLLGHSSMSEPFLLWIPPAGSPWQRLNGEEILETTTLHKNAIHRTGMSVISTATMAEIGL